MDKTTTVNRRNFLSALGVTVGGTGLAGAGMVAGPQLVKAATEPPKGKIPDTPYKIGHMTFLTGPAAVLGEPSLKGHILAAEEINAQGGLLGKRKIETITADESAGTDANVKELRRHEALREDRPLHRRHLERQHARARPGGRGARAADDLRRRLHRLPVRQGGAEPEIHLPHHQHPVGGRHHLRDRRGADLAAGRARSPTSIPTTRYGRNAFDHFTIVDRRSWCRAPRSCRKAGRSSAPPTSPRTSPRRSRRKPDLLVPSVWGGDYVAFYKQALRYGMFDKMKFATTIAFGVAPHAHRQGSPGGRASPACTPTTHFTYPRRRPLAAQQDVRAEVLQALERVSELPVGGRVRHALHAEAAIEKANKLVGGWPDDEAIISQLEGMDDETPSGYLYIRPDNHQGYKDAVTGFSKNIAGLSVPDPGIPTGSSPSRSATSRRRRTGRSPATATTIRPRPPTGSRRPGRRR